MVTSGNIYVEQCRYIRLLRPEFRNEELNATASATVRYQLVK